MMALLVILLTHLLMASSAHAQGVGGVYCAQYSDGSSPDCGFSSLQMCEQSVTGVGGVCTQNPAGPSAALVGGQEPYASPPVPQLPFVQSSAFPAAPVPPPPFDQSASPQPPGEINSLSSDLAMRGNPPTTLGAVNFSGAGSSACIGLFGRSACGGT
jgi:hypothetical protein